MQWARAFEARALSVSGLARDVAAERCLCGGEARDRNAVGRAGDVIEADGLAEPDGFGISAVLAADPKLDVLANLPASFGRDPHEFSDAILIDGGIRIVVLACDHRGVRIGIEAPATIGIVREEIASQSADENRRASGVEAARAWLSRKAQT